MVSVYETMVDTPVNICILNHQPALATYMAEDNTGVFYFYSNKLCFIPVCSKY